VVVDANGFLLATLLTAANVSDSVVFEAVLNTIPALHRPFGARGHPRHRLLKVQPIRGTTNPIAGAFCRGTALGAGSRGPASSPARAKGATAGWWSAPEHGSIAVVVPVSGMNDAPTCTPR
jgi:hypothetical protein